jgi:hypothetical protein
MSGDWQTNTLLKPGGVVPVHLGPLTLQPDELGAADVGGVAVLLEPVGQHQARRIVLRVLLAGAQQREHFRAV